MHEDTSKIWCHTRLGGFQAKWRKNIRMLYYKGHIALSYLERNTFDGGTSNHSVLGNRRTSRQALSFSHLNVPLHYCLYSSFFWIAERPMLRPSLHSSQQSIASGCKTQTLLWNSAFVVLGNKILVNFELQGDFYVDRCYSPVGENTWRLERT